MSTVTTEQNAYAAQFETTYERLPGRHLPWVEQLRQRGIADFRSLGFPTTKLENWKYTNVAPIRRIAFQPAIDDSLPSMSELDSYPTPRLVFVNGRFVPTFSTIDIGLNLHLLTIGEALRDPERGSIVAMHLGRYTNT